MSAMKKGLQGKACAITGLCCFFMADILVESCTF